MLAEHILTPNENKFTAKNLDLNEEIEEAFRLRYKIFCEGLKWFPLNDDGKECDQYDLCSVHFGVYSSAELVGYSRIIPPENTFMLEKEFKDLLDESYSVQKEKNTGEISRLAIKKDLRLTHGFQISIVLYKLMYHWSLENKMRYWYMVVDTKYLKSLQRLFPCRKIGKVKFYQPNLPTTVAILDLREAEKEVFKKSPELYNWFVSPNFKKKGGTLSPL